MWIECFEDYLESKGLGPIDDIRDLDLPKILESFYVDVRSQKVIVDANDVPVLNEKGEKQYEEYTNNSMRALCAGLNQHFKLKLNVNIIDNPAFIRANELFAGKLHINKQEGKGTTRHKEPISEQDLKKLKLYFERNMAGPPNATLLQEIVLFNIIFYMGRHGRENLRYMTKDTFAIEKDGNGVHYIYQLKDETDKNHDKNDTDVSNQARIYEVPGEKTHLFHFKLQVIIITRHKNVILSYPKQDQIAQNLYFLKALLSAQWKFIFCT